MSALTLGAVVALAFQSGALDGSGEPMTFLLALGLLIGLPLVIFGLGRAFERLTDQWY